MNQREIEEIRERRGRKIEKRRRKKALKRFIKVLEKRAMQSAKNGLAGLEAKIPEGVEPTMIRRYLKAQGFYDVETYLKNPIEPTMEGQRYFVQFYWV